MAACERAYGATERGTDDVTMTDRDSALVHKSEAELQWARSFCQSRLAFSKNKRGASRWRKLLKEIEVALQQAGAN